MQSTCSGTTDGVRCCCLRCKVRPNQNADEPVTCLNCGHFDTCHPDEKPPSRKSNITAIVSGYSQQIRSKVSEMQARGESSSGFRKADIGQGGHKVSVKTNSKGQFQPSDTKAEPKLSQTAVGQVVMIPNGIRKNDLDMASAPSTRMIQHYRQCGLAVEKDRDGEYIRFLPDMSWDEIDQKLRKFFPKVFAYLDKHSPAVDGQSQCVLAVKSGQSGISISSAAEPTGKIILSSRHPKGRNWLEQTVYFATRSKIPDRVWERWDIETEKSLGTDSDSEDEKIIPVKESKVKVQRKRGRKRSASAVISDLDSDSQSTTTIAGHGLRSRPLPRPIKKLKVSVKSEPDDKLPLFDGGLVEDDDVDREIMAGLCLTPQLHNGDHSAQTAYDDDPGLGDIKPVSTSYTWPLPLPSGSPNEVLDLTNMDYSDTSPQSSPMRIQMSPILSPQHALPDDTFPSTMFGGFDWPPAHFSNIPGLLSTPAQFPIQPQTSTSALLPLAPVATPVILDQPVPASTVPSVTPSISVHTTYSHSPSTSVLSNSRSINRAERPRASSRFTFHIASPKQKLWQK